MKSGGFSPGFVHREYFEAAAPYLSVFGFGRVDWFEADYYASKVGGALYYRPTRTSNEPDYLTWAMLDQPGADFDTQRREWFKRLEGDDGRMLDAVADAAFRHGKQLIVQLFNEQWERLGNLDSMRRYAEWSEQMAVYLFQHYGAHVSASVWGGGMGWLNPPLVEALEPMLTVCRGSQPIAYFEQHYYGIMHQKVWTGLNQSHGIDENASNEEKLAALTRHPWNKPYKQGAELCPSWLTYRNWGYPNADGSFGFAPLRGVRKLAGEGPVDLKPPEEDHRLPEQAGRTPFELLPLLSRLLSVPQHLALLEVVKDYDRTFNALAHVGAPELRLTFAIAPGYSWSDYNYWYGDEPFQAWLDYLQAPKEAVEPIVFDDAPPVPPDESPPPDPVAKFLPSWSRAREAQDTIVNRIVLQNATDIAAIRREARKHGWNL